MTRAGEWLKSSRRRAVRERAPEGLTRDGATTVAGAFAASPLALEASNQVRESAQGGRDASQLIADVIRLGADATHRVRPTSHERDGIRHRRVIGPTRAGGDGTRAARETPQRDGTAPRRAPVAARRGDHAAHAAPNGTGASCVSPHAGADGTRASCVSPHVGADGTRAGGAQHHGMAKRATARRRGRTPEARPRHGAERTRHNGEA